MSLNKVPFELPVLKSNTTDRDDVVSKRMDHSQNKFAKRLSVHKINKNQNQGTNKTQNQLYTNKVITEKDLNKTGKNVNNVISNTFRFHDKVQEKMMSNLKALKDKQMEK